MAHKTTDRTGFFDIRGEAYDLIGDIDPYLLIKHSCGQEQQNAGEKVSSQLRQTNFVEVLQNHEDVTVRKAHRLERGR